MQALLHAAVGLAARLVPLWLSNVPRLDSSSWSSWCMLLLGSHSNDHFLECAYRHSAAISSERILCPAHNMMNLVALVPNDSRNNVLMAGGIILQIATTALLYKYSMKNNKKILWKLYWFNPIIILGGCNSFLLCLHHFLVILLLTSLEKVWTVAAIISLTLLSSWFDFAYIGAVFIASYSLITTTITSDRKLGTRMVYFLYTILLLIIAGFIVLYYLRYNTAILDSWYEQVYTYLFMPKPLQQYYYPSAGVSWYLEALTFKSHQVYFRYFILLQPLLFAPPIFVRFYGILKNEVIAIATVMLVLFLRRTNNYMDIMLLLLLPSRTVNILTQMRFLPLILLSVAVTAVMSPLMLSLWVQNGNGNANYLFFQGWTMCVFIALYITEYLNTAVRMLSAAAEKDKDV
jgi:hypothetical protein